MTQTVLPVVVKIKDMPFKIIDGDRGANYPNGNDFSESGYCLFLNAKNVTYDGFDFLQKQFITKEKDVQLRKGKLERHDVVLTTRGTVGNVAYYSALIPYENIRINSGMIILRCDNSKLLPEYLYFILKSKLFQDQVLNFRSGSAQPQLPIRDMQNMKLPLPCIEKQKEVICQIGTLDEKIELNRKINETLEQMGQALFRHYFVDNVETERWDIVRLKDIVDNVKVPLISGAHLSNYIYLPIDRLQMKGLSILGSSNSLEAKSSLIGFEKDDILVGAMRVYFHRVNIAPLKGVTRTTTFVLRAREEYLKAYAVLLINQESTISFANAQSKGSTMPYAIWDNGLGDMLVHMPPNKLLQEFQNKVWPMLELIRDSYKEIQTLTTLRDTLLPRLISGKIEL